MHVHIASETGEAKFWLKPDIALVRNFGYSQKQLREIESLIEVHYDDLIRAWQQHFGG